MEIEDGLWFWRREEKARRRVILDFGKVIQDLEKTILR